MWSRNGSLGAMTDPGGSAHPVIDVDVHVTFKQQPHNVGVTAHAGKRQGALPLLGQDVRVSTLGKQKSQGPQVGQPISKAAASEASGPACPRVPRTYPV